MSFSSSLKESGQDINNLYTSSTLVPYIVLLASLITCDHFTEEPYLIRLVELNQTEAHWEISLECFDVISRNGNEIYLSKLLMLADIEARWHSFCTI